MRKFNQNLKFEIVFSLMNTVYISQIGIQVIGPVSAEFSGLLLAWRL